jgi:hypothetical protein
MTMSREPSTAALDSFRHESFRIRRRAPRHPAGASIRSNAPTVSRQTVMNSHPKNSSSSRDFLVILEIYCHPERSAGFAPRALRRGEESAFRSRPNRTIRKQYGAQTEVTQARFAILKEEPMNHTTTNRPTRSAPLTFPAHLRVLLALLLLLLGVAPALPTFAQTRTQRTVKTYPTNRANAENLQRWVNAGHDTWCRDPKLAAAHTLEQFAPGLADATYGLASQPVVHKLFHGNTAIYTYHSLDGQTTYRVTLRRPQSIRSTAGSVHEMVWIPQRVEIFTDSITD